MMQHVHAYDIKNIFTVVGNWRSTLAWVKCEMPNIPNGKVHEVHNGDRTGKWQTTEKLNEYRLIYRKCPESSQFQLNKATHQFEKFLFIFCAVNNPSC